MGHQLTQSEVGELVHALLAEILELNLEDVGPDEDLVDELDADSLQRLELMTEVEHRLGIRIDARAWRAAHTLNELTELTLETLAEPQPQ